MRRINLHQDLAEHILSLLHVLSGEVQLKIESAPRYGIQHAALQAQLDHLWFVQEQLGTAIHAELDSPDNER